MSQLPENTGTLEQFFSRQGRYRIIERIGTGGMARVYKAEDNNLERLVAIKVLHEHLAEDDTFRARFEREAKFVAAFNHPHVIQIHDYATTSIGDRHLAYMVMAYLPGDNLNDVMDSYQRRGTRMPHSRVVAIIADIAAGLDYAHTQGTIHRDVKPANILFNERERAVLTDFGIARMAAGSNITRENVTVGTPAYMSPEQASGEEIDHRTDIYALGIILYELLAGAPPFADDGSLSILLKHLNEPVPSLSRFLHMEDANLDAVVFKALAKDPEDRYQTATALADDLRKAVAGDEPGALVESARYVRGMQATEIITSPVPSALETAPTQQVQTGWRIPLGILGVGITLITAVSIVGIIIGMSMPAPPTPAPQSSSTVPTVSANELRTLRGGIDSMVESVILAEPVPIQENLSFFSTFDGDDPYRDLWSQPTEVNFLRTMSTEGTYRLRNQEPGSAMPSIAPSLNYTTDLDVEMEAFLSETSPIASGYGIIFRYQNEDAYNVFTVDGMGRYSIWARNEGRWNELRNMDENWTFDDSVLAVGEVNRLRVEVRGNTITGYVNDVLVTTVEDDTFSEGTVGAYLGTDAEAETPAQLSVERFAVTVFDSDGNPVSSMVGN